MDGKTPELQRLVDLVVRLRAPDGCPWDREQTMAEVRAYLLEEAHEVADAIDRQDWDGLRGELGDLLFQLVFVSRLAEEEARFTLREVIDEIRDKMIARHPHVFGEEAARQDRPDVAAVASAWERRKLAQGEEPVSLLSGLPRSLPALLSSYRMTQKAAAVGFDWSRPEEVLEKVEEELEELREAMALSEPQGQESQVREELGDLLFTVANLARHFGFDPEAALAQTNLKYRHRFQWMETALRERGRDLATASLEEMDALWEEAKAVPRPPVATGSPSPGARHLPKDTTTPPEDDPWDRD